MKKKNRIYIIVTGLMAITLLWLGQVNKNRGTDLPPLTDANVSEGTAAKLDRIEGVLWSSDSEQRGNLMLVSKYTTIYLKTSRDFSSLIGKNVIVTADGTLDNFTLINVEENLIKDGFIQAQ